MRNALLVPTDFSENAWIALNYAVHLAERFQWNIQVLHVYQTFGNLLASAEFNDAVSLHSHEEAEKQMADLDVRIKKHFPEAPISTACMAGSLNDVIQEMLLNSPIQFIVMGTKGASGLKHVALGSNTYEVIQHSPIGVLAVPDTYQQFKLQKIGLLTNFKPTELELLSEFTQRTSSAFDLALLHVSEGDAFPSQEDVSFWQDQILKSFELNQVTYHSKEMVNRLDVSEPITKCVDQFVDEEEIDLLLVSFTRKSFFRRLFSRSLPKALAHHMKVPTYFSALEK